MLTMCWSLSFISIALLLVQPSQALHDYHSREPANTRSISSLAGRSVNKGSGSATIVAIILVLLASVVAVTGSYIWYTRRKNVDPFNNGNLYTLGSVGWWSQVRHGAPPTDIEKGGVSFQSRFATLRSANKEKFGLPPQIFVEEPPAPVLPHIPRYPSVLERISNSRASMLFSNTMAPKPPSSRALVPGNSIKHGSDTGGRQGKNRIASPTEYMKSWFRQTQNPFVPTPHNPPVSSQIPSPQDSDISSIPLTSPPDTSLVQDEKRRVPVSKARKLDSTRAERVRMLHMDLSQDFRALEALKTLPTPMRIVHLGEVSAAKLQKAKTAKSLKTGKSLRFLLPSSPKNSLKSRVVAVPSGGNGKGNLRSLLSASDYSQSNRKPPKTAYV